MKRLLLASIVLALLLTATPVAAGDLALFGSWLSTKDLDDSFGGGLKFDFTFGETFGMEFRGTYYPELGQNFGDLIDDDDELFALEVDGIAADMGFILQFGPGKNFFLSAGGTYWFLDSNVGNFADEVGWYLAGGFKSGRPAGGVGFFLEGIYRDVDGTLSTDLGELDDIDDIDDIERAERVILDLSGVGVNLGVLFRF